MLIVAVLCAVTGQMPAAWSAPATSGVDLNAEQRVLVAQLTLDKAITVALAPDRGG